MKTTTLPAPARLTAAIDDLPTLLTDMQAWSATSKRRFRAGAAYDAVAAEWHAVKDAGLAPSAELCAREAAAWSELQAAEAAHRENRMRR